MVVVDGRMQREENGVFRLEAAELVDGGDEGLIDGLHDRFGAKAQGPEGFGGRARVQDGEKLFAPANHLDVVVRCGDIAHADGIAKALEQFRVGNTDDPFRLNPAFLKLKQFLLVVLATPP